MAFAEREWERDQAIHFGNDVGMGDGRERWEAVILQQIEYVVVWLAINNKNQLMHFIAYIDFIRWVHVEWHIQSHKS